MNKKPLKDHTDRELLEKSLLFQKETANNTKMLKNLAIIYAVLVVIGGIMIAAQM